MVNARAVAVVVAAAEEQASFAVLRLANSPIQLVLAACTAKKASKVKATKPPNEYSTKNTTIAASPWRRKGAVFEEIGPGRFALFGGKVKDPRANNGTSTAIYIFTAASSRTRRRAL